MRLRRFPGPGRIGSASAMLATRRRFLKTVAASAAAVVLPATCAITAPAGVDSTLPLSAPLTHSDWMLKAGMKWGPEGVHHMLDACKACGWSRVHWRVLDGGRAAYPSKVVRPSFKVDQDTSTWNPQTDAEKAIY